MLLNPVQPKEKGLANQIMIFKEGSNNTTIFIPVFMRFQLLSFETLKGEQLLAELNGLLHLYIYFGTLPKHVINYVIDKIRINPVLQHSILLEDPQSNDDDQIDLKTKHQQIQYEESGLVKISQFKIRKVFLARIQPFIFYTPFQLLDIQLSIELCNTIQNRINQQNYRFRFNLMNLDYSTEQKKKQNNYKCVSYSVSGSIGYYDLAQTRLCAEYNSRDYAQNLFQLMKQQKFSKQNLLTRLIHRFHSSSQNKEDKSEYQNESQHQNLFYQAQPIKAFNYAHYHLPVYKNPFVGLATIYFPLWMLQIILIATYHGQSSLNDELATQSFIAIGFIQTLINIRGDMPVSSRLTFIEYNIYITFMSLLFSLIFSLESRNEKEQNVQLNALYYISTTIFIITLIIPILAYIYFKVVLQKQLNQKGLFYIKKQNYAEIDPNYNHQANQYYEKLKDQTGDNLIFQKNKHLGQFKYNEQYDKFIDQTMMNEDDWLLT